MGPPPGPPARPRRHVAGFVVGLIAVIVSGLGFAIGGLIDLTMGTIGDVNDEPALFGQLVDVLGYALTATVVELGLSIGLLVRASRHQHKSARTTRGLVVAVLVGAGASVGLWAWFLVLNARYGG